MPDDDGYATAQRLREEKQTSRIPIIFFTNEDSSPEAEKAMKELWVSDYIHKSVDLNVFIEKINKVLEESSKKSFDPSTSAQDKK